MAKLWLRRWTGTGNEYLRMEGPEETLDAIFLAIAHEGWVPWVWDHEG